MSATTETPQKFTHIHRIFVVTESGFNYLTPQHEVVTGTVQEALAELRTKTYADSPLTEDHPSDVAESWGDRRVFARYDLGGVEHVRVTVYEATEDEYLESLKTVTTATDEDF